LLFFFRVADPALARPIPRNANSKVGVDARKQPLTEGAVKKFLLKLIYAVAGSKAVTMANKQTVVTYLQHLRLPVDGYSQLFREVIKHPHVVVSREECDRDSLIAKLGKFALKPDKSFGYGVGILEPEIKNVAKQKNCVRVMADGLEPRYNLTLTFEAVFSIGCTQVEVGGEIYPPSRGQLLDRRKHWFRYGTMILKMDGRGG